MKIKLSKYTIAGGNPTFLVEDYPEDQKTAVVKKCLQESDQVGFISNDGKFPTLEMMGGELCINATLAFAKQLGKSGQLMTSGVKLPIKYSNISTETTATFELPYEVTTQNGGQIVLLPGIGFYCTSEALAPTQGQAEELARKYKLPAFGFLTYGENQINPTIYVQKTNSFVNEKACGSGSVALNILTGSSMVTQPTSQRISVARTGNQFTLGANVVKIKPRVNGGF